MKRPLRVRVCLWFCSRMLLRLGWFIRLIVGPDGVAEVFRGILELQKTAIDGMPANASRHGLAREGTEMMSNIDRAAAAMRPDTPWTFHKDYWGDCEVSVMPRVVDSNTGVVVGPPGHPNLGAVVTNDHCAPNCDPSALNAILHGPPMEEAKTA